MVNASFATLMSGYVLLGLSACTVAYDENTDQQVTSITQQGNQQLATWEDMIAGHQAIDFDAASYSRIQGELQTLENRLATGPTREPIRDTRSGADRAEPDHALDQYPRHADQARLRL